MSNSPIKKRSKTSLPSELTGMILSNLDTLEYDMYKVEYIRFYADLVQPESDMDDGSGPDAVITSELIQRFVKVFKTQESFNLYVGDELPDKVPLLAPGLRPRDMEFLENNGIQFGESEFWQKILKTHVHSCISTKRSTMYYHRSSTFLRYAITNMSAELI